MIGSVTRNWEVAGVPQNGLSSLVLGMGVGAQTPGSRGICHRQPRTKVLSSVQGLVPVLVIKLWDRNDWEVHPGD